jgi:hypothetical protein
MLQNFFQSVDFLRARSSLGRESSTKDSAKGSMNTLKNLTCVPMDGLNAAMDGAVRCSGFPLRRKRRKAMKRHMLLISSLLMTLLAIRASHAMQSRSIDSTAAFDRLKTLVGEWHASSNLGKVHVKYELISGGSVLLARESVENMPPMATAYHLDGERLLLTHYCMVGNQPRMQANAFNADSGELKFEFLDATNLKGAGAGHMHNARFRFVDQNRFVAEWDFYENGQRQSTEAFNFSRIP